jgi:hypothetical protein
MRFRVFGKRFGFKVWDLDLVFRSQGLGFIICGVALGLGF